MSDEKYKVLLFTTNLGSRQASKIREGFLKSPKVSEIVVCGFLRNFEPPPGFKCIIFGNARHEKYFERLFIYFKIFFWMLSNLRKFDAVFTWTVDSAALLYLAKRLSFAKCSFIYNIRDVHHILTNNGAFGKAMRFADKFVSEGASLIMLTSPFYKTEYYKKWLHLKNNKFFLLENKVPPETVELFERDSIPVKECSDTITIGYFGLMSYADRIYDVMKAVSETGKKIYLRGHNFKGDAFVKGLLEYPNIEYGGGYKNPDELGDMFSKIDISWAVNSGDFVPNTNLAWAMSNRFYEGLYFKKPLIVQDFTPAAEYVKKYDVGLCIDNRDIEDFIRKVAAITKEDIARWRANIEKIDEEVFVLGKDEYGDALELAMRPQN